MPSPVIVLAAGPELRTVLEAGGFEVREAASGFAEASALVLEVSEVLLASQLTSRWRAEFGDRAPPVLWILNEANHSKAMTGLNGGADAVSVPPLDSATIVAQVRALARGHARFLRFVQTADEARDLNERLQQAFARIEDDASLTHAAAAAVLPKRWLAGPNFRVAVAQRSASNKVGQFDIARVGANHLVLWVSDIGGTGVSHGVLALATRAMIAGREQTDAGPAPPAMMLNRINRGFVALERDIPLVGLAYVLVDGETGRVDISRSGVPFAVHLPAEGSAKPWGQSGPFLGAFDAEFPGFEGHLSPGDRLVIASSGDASETARSATVQREQPNQNLADAIAVELLSRETERDGVTVLVMEYRPKQAP